MKNFEKGAQGVPGEKSPAEKSPEEIREVREESKALVNDWILKMENEMSREEWNRFGTMLIKHLDHINEDEIRSYYTEGVEGFITLANLASTRGIAAELERSAENLEAEQNALRRENGEDRVEKGQPYPELENLASEEDVGEKSNP